MAGPHSGYSSIHPVTRTQISLLMSASSNFNEIWVWVHAWVEPAGDDEHQQPDGIHLKKGGQFVGVLRVSLPLATGARPNRVSTIADGGYLPVPAQ